MSARIEKLPSPGLGARIQNHPLSQSIVAGIAGMLDGGVSAISGLLIYAGYVAPQVPGKFPFYAAAITAFSLILVQSLYAAGLYRFSALMAPARNAPRQIAVYLALFLLFVACGFALKISDQFSRVWAFSWLTINVVSGVTVRFLIAALVKSWAGSGRIRRNIVIYGAGEHGERLVRHIESLREPWNQIIGVFDDRLGRVGKTVAGYPVLGNLSDLIGWGRENRADEVLIALPWSAQRRLLGIMHCIAALPTNVRLSPEFVGVDRLHRQTTYQFGVPMLNVLEKPVTGWGALSKAILDRLLGIIFVILALPIMTICAIAIRIESKGPVLFRQQRLGFNHQPIEVYKFRTMFMEHADRQAEQLTQRNDPRVTKVGVFLRRFSLDELPQLYNVLRGEMSVVGPRPHALKAKAGGRLYEDVVDEYANRHKVKPGITGWAQVNGWRGNTETEEDLIGRVEHDLYYIENWSLLFDLIIILRTAWVVVQGRNSY